MTRQSLRNVLLLLIVVALTASASLTACAGRTATIKALLNNPNSPRYPMLDGQAQKGEGERTVYPIAPARARALTLFILGAHEAVGIAERGSVLYATIPDLRPVPFPADPAHNAIRIELTALEPGSVQVTTVSRAHSPTAFGQHALSARQFQEEFAAAVAHEVGQGSPDSTSRGTQPHTP